MDGFINLLKPPGMTSSDAVLAVRRLLPRKTNVGHGGTLDPEAAGVLPICVGRATRLFDYIIDKDKTYIGELLLGVITDTLDASGKVIKRSEAKVSHERLDSCLKRFVGEIMQVPPIFSAIKKDGEPLYRKARKGESLDLAARPVRISSLEIVSRTASDRYLLKIVCGKGVYIRSLMRDIGEALGCGGCMSFLIRTQAGALHVDDSLTLDDLKRLDDISDAILPPDTMLSAYPRLTVQPEKRANVLNGQSILTGWLSDSEARPGDTARLYVGDEFAGMGAVDPDGSVKIRAMLLGR